jgi:hypothetical protein
MSKRINSKDKDTKDTNETKRKRTIKIKQPSTLNTLLNNNIDDNINPSEQYSNKEQKKPVPEHNFTNQPDDMEDILKEINEREIAMALDESYARSLENEMKNMNINNNLINNNLINNDNLNPELPKENEPDDIKMSEIIENIRLMEEMEKKQNHNHNININPIIESRNIISEQDREYEEALKKDEELERKAKIDEMNRREEEEIQMAIKESLEAIKNINQDEINPVIEEKEDIPLTKEELRKARLAFYSKKN